MSWHFSKMHGIGNDFVVLDGREGRPEPGMIRVMADRHTGIGFDQLLSVEAPRDPSCQFYYGIWNADGSMSGQCGNGVRCVVAWLHRAGVLALGDTVRLESPSGVITACLLATDRVAVAMGQPCFSPASIPFEASQKADCYDLEVEDRTWSVGIVSMGNPHAVLVVDNLHAAVLASLGPAISSHPRFAQGTNTGFVQCVDRDQIHLRVHERGAGWTRACGSGACAAMAVLRQRDQVNTRVQVTLPGGTLQIDWPGPGHMLWMTGPVAFVFDGQWLARADRKGTCA